jgi:hypothetical protein
MTQTPKRIWILSGSLLIGFSCTFLLPETSPMHSSRIATEFPERFGDWTSRKVAIGDRELSVLADDTVFERRIYTPVMDLGAPPVEASVVFSGKDMNNSIHRPEVCLRTQGWNFARERYVTIHDALPNGEAMVMREILCNKYRLNPETGQPLTLPNGKILVDWQLIYYTFIGANAVTASHYGRVFNDIQDRIVGGFDQQWAYATFSSVIPGKYRDQDVDIGLIDALDEEETGNHLANFIKTLMPLVIDKPEGRRETRGQDE